MMNNIDKDAGFLLRAWAALVDLSLISVAIPFFTTLAEHLGQNVIRYFVNESVFGEGLTQELAAATFTAFLIAIGIAAVAWFLASSLFLALSEWLLGASPGKLLIGLRVVTERQSFPFIFRSLLRQSAKSLSSALLGFGFLMPLWTKRRQALHDKIARCYVVRRGPIKMWKLAIAAGLSALLLIAAYPAIKEKFNAVAAPIEQAVAAYRTPGPIEQIGWMMVKEGFRQFQQAQDSQ